METPRDIALVKMCQPFHCCQKGELKLFYDSNKSGNRIEDAVILQINRSASQEGTVTNK